VLKKWDGCLQAGNRPPINRGEVNAFTASGSHRSELLFKHFALSSIHNNTPSQCIHFLRRESVNKFLKKFRSAGSQ
jgi:hypothetical protein